MGNRARELLEKNLRNLIGEGKPLAYGKVLATKKISNGTLGRSLNAAEAGAKLDTLDDLCAAFAELGVHVEPWQLLHPNPESVPNLPDEIQGIADAIARIPGDLQRAQALARAYRAAFRSDRHEDAPEEVQTTQEPREVHRG